MWDSKKTPEFLAKWRAEIPELEVRFKLAKDRRERFLILSKLYIRMREFHLISEGMTFVEYCHERNGDCREKRLEKYREELPELRKKFKNAHGDERKRIRGLIVKREIALGLRKKKHTFAPGEKIVWHMEFPADCTPLCAPHNPLLVPNEFSLHNASTTTNWKYVTCADCLALQGTPLDPYPGPGLFIEAPPPRCCNCWHWISGNRQPLDGKLFGVCVACKGFRIITEAEYLCKRWRKEEPVLKNKRRDCHA